MKFKTRIPYGRSEIGITFSEKRILGVLQGRGISVKGPGALTRESLDSSLSNGKARFLLKGKKKVLIVTPDKTRNSHLESVMPCLLKRLKIKHDSITIIVATGLHKKHSRSELLQLLGKDIVKRYEVISHCQDKGGLLGLGKTSGGVPIVLNRLLTEADLVITVGCVEPHLYAGYSGGAKTIAIGLAGERLINKTHGLEYLDHPKTGIGIISGNPFQRTLWEIIRGIPVDFAVNIVNGPDGKAMRVFSGKPRDVFERSVKFAGRVFEVEANKPADIVICGVGYPKDINLYQASRAINYVANVERPVLKKGGVLLVVAELKDGIGAGITEKRFYDELKEMVSPEKYIRESKMRGCSAGAHRAYMISRPLMDYDIAFVSRGNKRFMEGLPFKYFSDLQEALRYADTKTGNDSKIYVIPHALSTIAMLKRKRPH